ncbi:hypothetical protein F0562_031143 [Nyssa sinensis]|uniref:Epidermal patterning factor-like protein n=1 Tax=Nyssa sinensis TaxID=561372 RepID=A0A5J5AQV8_9ASTE|nr:hypothetical protein F0562_031143 [Nyssa sinensis]
MEEKMSACVCGFLFSLFLLLFFTLNEARFNHANELAAVNGTAVAAEMEMTPLMEPGKAEMMVEMNETRRRLGSFQICALCTCCGGAKGCRDKEIYYMRGLSNLVYLPFEQYMPQVLSLTSNQTMEQIFIWKTIKLTSNVRLQLVLASEDTHSKEINFWSSNYSTAWLLENKTEVDSGALS